MGGTDGDCFFCQHGMENLCDHPTFTGYSFYFSFKMRLIMLFCLHGKTTNNR